MRQIFILIYACACRQSILEQTQVVSKDSGKSESSCVCASYLWQSEGECFTAMSTIKVYGSFCFMERTVTDIAYLDMVENFLIPQINRQNTRTCKFSAQWCTLISYISASISMWSFPKSVDWAKSNCMVTSLSLLNSGGLLVRICERWCSSHFCHGMSKALKKRIGNVIADICLISYIMYGKRALAFLSCNGRKLHRSPVVTKTQCVWLYDGDVICCISCQYVSTLYYTATSRCAVYSNVVFSILAVFMHLHRYINIHTFLSLYYTTLHVSA
jgi:hypothetical protein